jgi:CrcB protein
MTPGVVFAVLVAGALGALARFGISLGVARYKRFPAAVLIVNVVGAAIGGTVLGLAHHAGISTAWHLILLTGLAGGLTTFSTWSVETMQLIESGRSRTALLSVGANLLLGIAVATLTYLLFS